VESELDSLGMAGSRFQVLVTQREAQDGAPVGPRRLAFGPQGVDLVSFQVAANKGEPPRPLVAVSSGGETARVMLGLKSVLQAADRVPVLVFDEIDAGIGGRVGAVVGRRLWSLTARHQVLCVTHLPQVAVYGDVHWHVRKQVVGGRTVTVLTRLEAADRVNEIAQMLGTVSATGRQSALQLLQEAEGWKAEQGAATSALR
jgi:DNA repair protein RecN (Recombination protein N)